MPRPINTRSTRATSVKSISSTARPRRSSGAMATPPPTAWARLLPATTTTAIRCFSARTTWNGCPTAISPSSTTARIAPAPTAAPSWKSIPPPIRWSGSTKPRITTVSIPTSSQRPRNSPTATGSSPPPTTGIFSKSPRTSRWSGNTTIPSPPTIRPIA